MIPTFADTDCPDDLRVLGWFVGGKYGRSTFAFSVCSTCHRGQVHTLEESLNLTGHCVFCELDRRKAATQK